MSLTHIDIVYEGGPWPLLKERMLLGPYMQGVVTAGAYPSPIEVSDELIAAEGVKPGRYVCNSKTPDGRYLYRWIETGFKIDEVKIKHYTECRDMFCVGSVSWNLLDAKIEAVRSGEDRA